jgi:plasmid maintenance system antidote protein VapI
MTFAALLAAVLADVRLRISNGEFTERALARRLRVSQSQMHNVLKGARTLSPALADRLLATLGVGLLDIMRA